MSVAFRFKPYQYKSFNTDEVYPFGSFIEMYYYAYKSTPVVAHYECRQGRVLCLDIIHYWFLLNKLQIVIWVRPFIQGFESVQ
jgi:hypothetical protein